MAGEDMGMDFVMSGQDNLTPILNKVTKYANALDKQMDMLGKSIPKDFAKVSLAAKKEFQGLDEASVSSLTSNLRKRVEKQIQVHVDARGRLHGPGGGFVPKSEVKFYVGEAGEIRDIAGNVQDEINVLAGLYKDVKGQWRMKGRAGPLGAADVEKARSQFVYEQARQMKLPIGQGMATGAPRMVQATTSELGMMQRGAEQATRQVGDLHDGLQGLSAALAFTNPRMSEAIDRLATIAVFGGRGRRPLFVLNTVLQDLLGPLFASAAAISGLTVAAIDFEEELYPLTREIGMTRSEIQGLKDAAVAASMAVGTSTETLADMAQVLAAGAVPTQVLEKMLVPLGKMSAIFPGMEADIAGVVYGMTAFIDGTKTASGYAEDLTRVSSKLVVALNKVAEISGASRQRIVQLAQDAQRLLRPSMLAAGFSADRAAEAMAATVSVGGFLESQFIDGSKAVELYDKMIMAAIDRNYAASAGFGKLYGILGLDLDQMNALAKVKPSEAAFTLLDSLRNVLRGGKISPFLLERMVGEQLGMTMKDLLVFQATTDDVWAGMRKGWADTLKEMMDMRGLDTAWNAAITTARQSLIRMVNITLTAVKSIGTPLVNLVDTLVFKPMLAMATGIGTAFGALSDSTRGLLGTFTSATVVIGSFSLAFSKLAFAQGGLLKLAKIFSGLGRSAKGIGAATVGKTFNTWALSMFKLSKGTTSFMTAFAPMLKGIFGFVAATTIIVQSITWLTNRLEQSRKVGGMLAGTVDGIRDAFKYLGEGIKYVAKPLGRFLQLIGTLAGIEVIIGGASIAIGYLGKMSIWLGKIWMAHPLFRMVVYMTVLETAVRALADGFSRLMKMMGFGEATSNAMAETIKTITRYVTLGVIALTSFGGITGVVATATKLYNSVIKGGIVSKLADIKNTVTLTKARISEASATQRAAIANSMYNRSLVGGAIGGKGRVATAATKKAWQAPVILPTATEVPATKGGLRGKTGALAGGAASLIGLAFGVTMLSEAAVDSYTTMTDTAKESGGILDKAWRALKDNILGVVFGISSLTASIGGISVLFGSWGGITAGISGVITTLTGAITGLVSGIGLATAATVGLVAALGAMFAYPIGSRLYRLWQIHKANKQVAMSEDFLSQVRAGAMKTSEGVAMASEVEIARYKQLRDQLGKGEISAREYDDSIKALRANVYGAGSALSKLPTSPFVGEGARMVEDISKDWAKSRADAMTALGTVTGPGGKALTPAELTDILSTSPGSILTPAPTTAAVAPITTGVMGTAMGAPVVVSPAPPVVTPVAKVPGAALTGNLKDSMVKALAEFFPKNDERVRRERTEDARMNAIKDALVAIQRLSELYPMSTLLADNMAIAGGGL